MESLNGNVEITSSYLLELASNNDLVKFRNAVGNGKSNLDMVGIWYCRNNGSSKMVLQHRTPIMVAALYGSLDVLSYILESYTLCGGDINKKCGTDGATALHCAAAGGSVLAVQTVNMLVENGADLNALDVLGKRPADVIAEFPGHLHLKVELQKILKAATLTTKSAHSNMHETLDSGGSVMLDNGDCGCKGVRRALDLSLPLSLPINSMESKTSGDATERPKEYPIDPSIPDIKNSMYASDEFRMFSFKVRPCSRAYSHDWTECPFVHPGENARRRDPRRYHYSCVPCPDFRKGACRRGDVCEYAHGVFECWLHPAQYRTRLCKDGTGCTRRVCFFAHTTEELRPLYVSTGSALPSPRTTASIDMAVMSPSLAPGSPSSVLMMSPFLSGNLSHQQGTLATPPMSPSSPSATSHPSSWCQPNVPALHLPGASLQSSRLRSTLSARDFSLELERVLDFDGQSLNDLTTLTSPGLSTQARLNAAVAASGCGISSARATKYKSLGFSITPTALDDVFASESISSPRLTMPESAFMSPVESSIQLQKPPHLQTHIQGEAQAQMQLQLQQSAFDSQLQGSSILNASQRNLGHMSSLGGLDVDRKNMNRTPPFSPMLDGQMPAAYLRQVNRSRSSHDLGTVGLSWPDWGSPTGKPEWGVHGGDLSKLRKSASFGVQDHDDLLSQKLIREESNDTDSAPTVHSGDAPGSNSRDPVDHSVLGSWIDSMHLDQLVA